MIDTHAHFNSKDLINLKEEINKVNSLSYLNKVINVGLDYETSKEAIEISLVELKFFATIGIHPLYDGNVDKLLNLYNKYDCSKVVAVGEIGLDTKGDLIVQEKKFISQIELANFLKLPIIIHANNTNYQVMDIIKKYTPYYGFVFHCFQPDLKVADEIIKLGGYISVGTNITRPTADKSLKVISFIPIERLLIELDYPYMSQNGEIDGRNVFKRIQSILNIDIYTLKSQLDSNAQRLFKKL